MKISYRVWNGEFWVAPTDTEIRYVITTDGSVFDMKWSDWHYNYQVCYSTSKQDKQGRTIYEGDILEFDEGEWGGKHRAIVTWDERDARWCFGGGGIMDLHQFQTIIGNIYENPELMEGY